MGSRGNNTSITFSDIVKYNVDASISGDKTLTILPENKTPYEAKHKDTETALRQFNTIRLNVYRDRSGNNTINRIQNAGFEIVKNYMGEKTQPDSKIPPRDYYILKRKK